MLAVCIVHKHHRELQSSCLIELNQPENTCSGLLAASYYIRNKVCVLCVHEIHKVTAVIDDDVRSDLENPSDMVLIFLRRCVIPRKYIEASLNQSSSDIILGRERIAAGHIHLGTTSRKNLTKVCCLGFKMYRQSHLEALERECLSEFFLERVEKGHILSYPVYLKSAFRPKSDVSDFACHVIEF